MPSEERAARRDIQGFGEQVGEVVHRHTAVAQGGGEGVVLLPGALCPHDVVEQQLVNIPGCQPIQLKPGSVQYHLPQLGR